MEMHAYRGHGRLGRRSGVAALLLAPMVLALSACGGSDEKATTTTSSSAQAHVVPAELVGSYERKVAAGQPGDPPSGTWKLAIGPYGEFFNVPPGETGFFNGPVSLTGDQMKIPAAPEAGCTSEGTYKVVAKGPRPGGTVTFTLVEDKFCEARTSVLAGVWTRTD
jgi:hypothetical protein